MKQETINELVQRLKNSGNYSYIGKNTDYKIPRFDDEIKGHLDVYALKPTEDHTYLLLFETCADYQKYNVKKAYRNLDNHELVIGGNADRVFKFIVWPDKIKWYKQASIQYDKS